MRYAFENRVARVLQAETVLTGNDRLQRAGKLSLLKQGRQNGEVERRKT